MLLPPARDISRGRGVITNLFPVEAKYSSRVHAVGRVKWTLQLASLACLHATKLTAQKARAWWRDTAKKVRNKNYCHCVLGASSTGVMALAVCVAVNKLEALSGNAVNISTSTADLTSTQCTYCKKCENLWIWHINVPGIVSNIKEIYMPWGNFI